MSKNSRLHISSSSNLCFLFNDLNFSLLVRLKQWVNKVGCSKSNSHSYLKSVIFLFFLVLDQILSFWSFAGTKLSNLLWWLIKTWLLPLLPPTFLNTFSFGIRLKYFKLNIFGISGHAILFKNYFFLVSVFW